MDLFKSCHYRTRRSFMLFIGQWPYNNSLIKSVQRFTVSLLLGSIIHVQIFKFFTTEWSIRLCIEIVPICLIFVLSTIKYICYWCNSTIVKTILNRIKHEWDSLSEIEEINILEKSAKEANLYGLVTIVFCYTGICLFLSLQYIPIVLDIIMPLNESRPNQHPFVVEYFIDSQKNFYPILMHMQISTLMSMTVIIGTDTMTMAILLHAQGMFNIIGYRLEHLFDRDTETDHENENKLVFFKRIVHIVNCHRKVVEYVQIVRRFLLTSYLIQMILLVIALIGFLLQLNDALTPMKSVDFVLLTAFRIGGLFLVAFLNILPAQRILDCSNEIFRRAYLGNWYTAPVKIQKILLILMRKIMTPCTISFGNILCMSFELYASIVRTTFSYFMAIYSMQCEPS